MGLIEDLGPGPVAIDTMILIYWMEEHPIFFTVLEPVFRAAEDERLVLLTSAVSLLEVLVGPLRVGNRKLASQYEALLRGTRSLRVVDISRTELRGAALVRAATGARTPDALQMATALGGACSAMLTNDLRMPAPPGLRLVQLSRYVAI